MHLTHNRTEQVPATKRKDLATDLREDFTAPTLETARTRAGAVTERSYLRLGEQLDDDLENALACLSFPAEYHPRIRTTNGLERLSQELTRRTWVVRIFPNREACLHLVTALAIENSDKWVSRRPRQGGGRIYRTSGT